jgi:hypothetical protein
MESVQNARAGQMIVYVMKTLDSPTMLLTYKHWLAVVVKWAVFPQVWEITMMFNPCLLTRDKKRSCMYVYVCVHLRQHLVAAGIMTVEVMNSD